MNGTIRALGTWTIDHSSSNARDPRARPAEPLYSGYLSDTDRARARSSSVHLHTVNGGWRTVVRNSLFEIRSVLWRKMFIFVSLFLFSLAQGHALALAFARHLRWSLRPGTPARKSPRDPYCYSPSRAPRRSFRDSAIRSHSGRNVESAWVRPKCPAAPGPTPMCKRIAGSRYSCSAVACRPIIRFRDLHASPGGVSTGTDREITD